ncbi:MAG: hypothetical protein LBB93_05645, partial [Elusimicrobiota bacterium]|nr:hypothetical protein [Elusimicrobiota bacterium]
ANFKRSAEALRTLEEYSKVFSPIHSVDFKAQRYKVYNLEKEFWVKYAGRFKNQNTKG